jgi:predicted MFS family arabinose efflux permease
MTRVLTLLALGVFSSALLFRSVDPLVPEVARGLGVPAASVALLSSAFALPYALSQPLIGALSDMFNKGRLITISLAILAASSVVCGVATRFDVLMAARIIAGLAAGGIVPIALAFAGDLVPLSGRQVAIGRILFAIMSGNILGSVGAGAIADVLGWRAVFFVMGGLGLAAAAVAVPGFRGVGAPSGPFDLSRLGPNYRAVFRNPLAKVCFTAVALEAIFMYGVFPYIAVLLQQGGETRASIAGIVISGFGVGGIVYSLSVAWLLPRLGERTMMRLGGVMMGLCVFVIALRLPWQAELVNFAVLGLSFYLLHAVIQVYVTELVPSARGAAMAMHTFFFFLGQAAGPVVYRVGFATVGPTVILTFGAIILVVVGFVCAHYLRRPQTS